ncbi:MAG TPA: glycosyltransferase family 1 protein [Bryobacteraceae bacterium]|nr:glycosyltransferase family 1 protein [Bryobacteraceae bacterium]
MIAALDATPLTLTSGGLARYVSELSLALARQFPEDTYALLSDQPFDLPFHSPPNLIAGPGVTDPRWWLRGVRRAMSSAGAQVFHGTNFEVPYLGRIPSILTIHDLSPWRDGSWHGRGADRVRTRTPWLIRLRRARAILTVSEAVRREIIAHFGVPDEMVRAIPLAATPAFYPVPETAAPPAPYFLFVGTLEPRKNLPSLIEAWRETYEETGAELWIVGRRRADFRRIDEEPGMKVLGEVPDSELPALYSSALAFVYPSLYEGFGLPVLEAMQCGCPVITSNDPAIREVSGDAAMHASSTAEIAQSMRVLAADPARRKELRKQGFARVKHYSWDLTARRTRALYQEVIGG